MFEKGVDEILPAGLRIVHFLAIQCVSAQTGPPLSGWEAKA